MAVEITSSSHFKTERFTLFSELNIPSQPTYFPRVPTSTASLILIVMSELIYTPLHEIENVRNKLRRNFLMLTETKIHAELRAGFQTGKLKSVAYRKYQLLQLAYLVKDNTERFEQALARDLGRPAVEGHL